MKDIALRAIRELSEKHKPEFIILYGSVVRGDHTENSDIDVACFSKNPQVSKDVRAFEGKKLDCWIYNLDDLNPTKNEFLRFVGGELFLDNEGVGRRFLNDVSAYFEKGPSPLMSDEVAHLIEWSNNMLVRASGNSVEAKYRRTWLPCELLEIYFNLRNHWYLGSKQSFSWLEKNDPEVHQLFEKAFSDPTSLMVLRDLVDAVANTEQIKVMDKKNTAPAV